MTTQQQVAHSTPADLADEMLAAVARHERAKAALEITRDQLAVANTLKYHLERTLAKIRDLHDTWGNTEDADPLVLWEDLGALLGPADTDLGSDGA